MVFTFYLFFLFSDIFDDDEDDDDDDDPTGSVVNEQRYQLYKKQRAFYKENLQAYAINKIQQSIQSYGDDFQRVLQNIPQYLLDALRST